MGKPSKDDTRSAIKRRADAFDTIMRFFLDQAGLPVAGGERPHLTFVFPGEKLDDGSIRITPGDSGLTTSDISQLLCGARISRLVLDANSVPLEIGRAVYTPSPALRRAIVVRDQGCRFPGCGRQARWGHVHHVVPFPEGETLVENLVLLCSFHHHLVHKPGWRNSFDGITYTVTRPDGRLLGRTRNRRSG